MDTSRLDEFVELTREKRDLEAKLKRINSELTALDNQLRETLFEPNGLTSIKNAGGTVSIRTDLYAGTAEGVDRDEAAEQLAKSEAYGYLVKPGYNLNSLSAAVREKARAYQEEAGDSLLELTPEERKAKIVEHIYGKELAALFTINEKQRLSVTLR